MTVKDKYKKQPQIGYKTHNYKIVNSTSWPTQQKVIDEWAKRGWRLVSVISDTRPGYAHSFIFERPVDITHPDD